jgi:succinyldiaminopimelate transaminase
VLTLPDFPWDSLAPVRERASAFSDPALDGTAGTGLVDLSVGTPVDPTPDVIRAALRGAADAPGYPATSGTPELRAAVVAWFARRRGVPDVDPAGVLPTMGSKELVTWLPTLLGLGAVDVVAFPAVAYPTYDVGARLARATSAPLEVLPSSGPPTSGSSPTLMWLNTPSNPTGAVLGIEQLAEIVEWARARGVVLASDECYAEFDWRPRAAGSTEPSSTPSILDPRVTGGSHEGLLCVYSLSKQSNLAGYRAAFVAGDPALVARLLDVRKHAGMIVPWPVQQAMIAALGDTAHVTQQRARYAARRATLLPAVRSFGLRVEQSEAGLYLWATAGEPGRETVERLAERGILVAPGDFYGAAGREHVRIALTATDERLAAAVRRLG